MAITLAHSATGGSSAASSTVTLSSTTAGNCLVVAIGADTGAGSISAVTLGGSTGNFSQLVANSSGSIAAIWADPNCAGGQTSLVVTTSAAPSDGTCIAVYEVAGLATSSVADKTSSGNGTSTTYSSGTTAVTTNATEFWVGVASAVTGSAMAGASGWTNTSLLHEGPGPVEYMIAGYQITSATGTATYSGSTSVSRTWGAAVACLKPATTVASSSGLLMSAFC